MQARKSNPSVGAMQSRALMYLFTLTHSLMEAMAAAEQAIELASDAANMRVKSLSRQSPTAATSNASSDAKTEPEHGEGASQNLSPVGVTQQSGTTHPTGPSGLPNGVQQSTHDSTANQDETGPIASCRQWSTPLQQHHHLQHEQSRDRYSDGDRDGERQPLIARPEGLLRVSVDQRPAKKHFDRYQSLLWCYS